MRGVRHRCGGKRVELTVRVPRLPCFMTDAKQDDGDQRTIRSRSLLYTQSLPLRQLSLVLVFGLVVLEMVVPLLVDLIALDCWPG